MNEQKKVSAIVPAFNEAPRISKILDTLTQSEYVDEIICVNDGSKDNTSEIVKRGFPNVVLLDLPLNKGKGNAMAEGVKKAKGKIVLFVDADLMGFCEENIKEILTPMISSQAEIVVGTRDYWVDNWFARSLSGERAYFKKDLLPLLPEISKLGYKVEVFLNYKFSHKKTKVVLIGGVVAPYKWHKDGIDKGLGRHVKMTQDIISHVFEQDSPIDYFYKSFIKNFYLPLDAKSISLKNYKRLTEAEMEQLSSLHKIDKIMHIKSVSVVIPAYNETDKLAHTLDALANQTVKPDEVIVVDNGSTDDTFEIARKYGCKVILEKRRGTSHARNAGFDAAQCEIIARTDADTVPDKYWIENIKKYTALGIEALTGPVYFDTPVLNSNARIFETYTLLMKVIFGHMLWFGPNMILSKKLWNEAKNHLINDDNINHEDTELALAVSKYAEIAYKRDLIVLSSSRRMRDNPASFFGEYPLRTWKMVARHQKAIMKVNYSKLMSFMNKEIFREDW